MALAESARRRQARSSVVHLVLHRGEEDLRLRTALHVVGSEGEDLPDALVNPLLARPDIPDAGEQFVEVVGRPVAALQAVVVERKTLDEILAEALCGPNPKLRAAL